jgi:hypothetical protein
MGRIDRVEASSVEEAEKWRRGDGTVSAEERRVADDAAEARARSAGDATRRKISSRSSLISADGGRSGSMASRLGRTG